MEQNLENLPNVFIPSGRETLQDQRIAIDLKNTKLINKRFVRLVALKISFEDVEFKYCIFDSCYLRNSTFNNCNFTGCKFIDSNLNGTQFASCKFDYAIFIRTQIPNDIIKAQCPSHDNLALAFSRSLKKNYTDLGDSVSANIAISLELESTKNHLKKSWQSPKDYYRKKYHGFKRCKMFFKWVSFSFLDFIWGNGESLYKLLRFTVLTIFSIAAFDLIYNENYSFKEVAHSLKNTIDIFFNFKTNATYPLFWSSLISVIRYTIFSFFISIIVKRLSRR